MARWKALDRPAPRFLAEGWTMTVTPAGALAAPPADAGLDWLPASVPGTAAAALAASGRISLDSPVPLHDKDIWYRRRIDGAGAHRLRFEGLATIAEVFLDDRPILATQTMFAGHEVDIDLAGEHTLSIAFRSLEAWLAVAKGQRARWRPRMIEEPKLRLARTTLLGHMPGWCPPVHAVGPWRPVTLAPGAAALSAVSLRSELTGDDGVLTFSARTTLGGPASLQCGGVETILTRGADDQLQGRLVIAGVERWWPHTHGTPHLHEVTLTIGGEHFSLGRTGFRSLTIDRGPDGKGFGLIVNGVPVFCRGACWTPPDLIGLPCGRGAYAAALAQAREANINMLRVGGTMAYEAPAFFDLCDELGILVWQDAMLANSDYPATDPAFLAAVRQEIGDLIDNIEASPSLAILCGGSEVFQQSAMMGLPEKAWSNALFDEVLPALLRECRPDIAYVPSSPCGGALPFLVDEGPGHYYGVGAYCRPLEDARRANVRFASECLAFAHVPEEGSPALLAAPAVHDPRWKQAVPRDIGASWDFEDVREHYMELLWRVDCRRLRYEDPARYLTLSRATTAEACERTIDEWRRPGSSNRGALVWLLQDFRNGAGWGIVDAAGRPKSTWHALRRSFAPLRLTISDEGVNGLVLHLVNDRPLPVAGTLVIECLKDGGRPVAAGRKAIEIGGHDGFSISAFALFGAFFDAGYAYRFGPPAHDVVVARLEGADGATLAEAFHLLDAARAGRHDIAIETAVESVDGDFVLALAANRAALFVEIRDEAFAPAENWFHLAPGKPARVALVRRPGTALDAKPKGTIHAVNLAAPRSFAG